MNPLAGDADYKPLAEGMAAAMPHVDGHDLGEQEELTSLASPLRRDA